MLTLNVAKTKYMALAARNTREPEAFDIILHSCGDVSNPQCGCEELERVKKYKYLGVMFDQRMSWEEHISYIKAKLRKLVYVFFQMSHILNKQEIRQVYHAYVQSILQFGIIAWGGAGNSVIEPILITQKALLKAALMKPRRYSTELLFAEMEVLDVRGLYIKSILLLMFKNKNSFFEPTRHLYNTRNSLRSGIQIPRLNNSASAMSAHYVAQILYRNIPPHLRDMDNLQISTYKKHVTQWLLSIGREASVNLLSSIYRR